ncbi:hypothetical protein emb_1d0401 [Coriobacteriaceae bacterium EMTCatB1]|nr:hypothetical protein emb_1d0401 [Coriobacteriaceae bacterium EMTCatB1]
MTRGRARSCQSVLVSFPTEGSSEGDAWPRTCKRIAAKRPREPREARAGSGATEARSLLLWWRRTSWRRLQAPRSPRTCASRRSARGSASRSCRKARRTTTRCGRSSRWRCSPCGARGCTTSSG